MDSRSKKSKTDWTEFLVSISIISGFQSISVSNLKIRFGFQLDFFTQTLTDRLEWRKERNVYCRDSETNRWVLYKSRTKFCPDRTKRHLHANIFQKFATYSRSRPSISNSWKNSIPQLYQQQLCKNLILSPRRDESDIIQVFQSAVL